MKTILMFTIMLVFSFSYAKSNDCTAKIIRETKSNKICNKQLNKVIHVKPGRKDISADLLKKSQDLEATLLYTMVDRMIPEGRGTSFGDNTGSNIYRTLTVMEYSKVLSRQGGMGMANNIAKIAQGR